MRRLGFWAGVAVVASGVLIALSGVTALCLHLAPGSTTQSALAEEVDRLLAQSGATSALWGVEIHSAVLGTLYTRNERQPFVPASNTKLLMAAAVRRRPLFHTLVPGGYRS
jgi:D-alanyl-D-alanine carboxypeptidase